MITDIVMMTYKRTDYLERTYKALRERTSSPFRLHIINDGGELPEYIEADTLMLRRENRGIDYNLLAVRGLVSSDIFVLYTDDVMCPAIEPDWLERGLQIIRDYPELGLLGLNEPDTERANSRHVIERGDPITWCARLGGQILFIRREILMACPDDKILGQRSPVKQFCIWANQNGWRSGFLTNVYAWHFGTYSIRLGENIPLPDEPADLMTLRPK